MTFAELNLIEPIQRALIAEGYVRPTPIQSQSIPELLKGKDLLGSAQTGTGKTAAFAIPILQSLFNNKNPEDRKKRIKSLILTPTRELAIQINDSFAAYGKFTGINSLVIFGGVSQKAQTDALRRVPEILVATPGRLLDLINQGFINLNDISLFVLDEADRMLDMGFLHDVKKIIAMLPAKRQSMFFSATMPPEIQKLSSTILTNPVKVRVDPESSTVDIIRQAIYYVDKADKRSLLVHLLKDRKIDSALVFTRTKHGADKVAKDLKREGISVAAIHGNKSQNARQDALNGFKAKTTRVLVATDIAARGIDVEELTHVINYELPNIPETYVHRIGRTGRAGAGGSAWSFCDAEEKAYLKDIQKLIAKIIPVVSDHPYPLSPDARPPDKKETKPREQWTRKPDPKKKFRAASSNTRNATPARSRKVEGGNGRVS